MHLPNKMWSKRIKLVINNVDNSMHRYAITLLICFCFLLGTNAQETTRFDLRTHQKLNSRTDYNTIRHLLVRGDIPALQQLIRDNGGTVNFFRGNIASIQIPTNKLSVLLQSKAIEKIEYSGAKGKILLDTALVTNGIDGIHNGMAPLVKAYKGTGVVVGILDGGIYWQHGDFRKLQDSTTRIRFIWDQDATGLSSPAPYNYGNQWNWIDIDNGNCTHVPPASDFGHGTCVAGIAAGNSQSTKGTFYENKFIGVAPEAEIIAVKVKINDDDFLGHVADAVDYVFKKADALGKPCVINTSIGTYYGSHDGTDLATQLIEVLLEERKGRVLVAAGGNGGHIPHHLGYNVPSDSAYTFFKYNSGASEAYFDLWADTADFNQVQFTVGCNDATGNNLGRLSYFTVKGDFNPPPGVGVILNRNLFNGPTLLGQISMQATLEGNKYHVEFLIKTTLTSNLWRLQTTGTGKFDLWSSSSLIGTSDMLDSIAGNYIQFPNYQHPDFNKTIVSSWQCSDKVITVGNYTLHEGYLDLDSNYVDLLAAPYNQIVGKRFQTSSFGPTRDGRLKPDVMATGSTTIATGDAGFIALATSPSNRVKVSITKRHIRNGGTSMASPIVAGIAALYLEKRPTARWDEIKQVIINTAIKDGFTGSTSNNEYGHGKVSGFAAMTYANFIYGTTDTSCLNYLATANLDTLGCEAKIYGCTDPTAVNYNPNANVNSNCLYSVGLNNVSNNSTLIVYPNPMKNKATFELRLQNYTNGEIVLINSIGEMVNNVKLQPGQSIYNIERQKLSGGIYFYTLFLDNMPLQSGKLIIE